jgi:hypothetical protein
MRRVWRSGLVPLVWLAGCAGPDPGSAPAPPVLDGADYAATVHPIFEARCATLDCHGHEDRPLRLYAATGLRRRDEWRDLLELTPEELEENVRAASALDASLLLDKPLGRIGHEGGTVWASADDPQHLCVRGWLASAPDPAACAVAFEQVELPPP